MPTPTEVLAKAVAKRPPKPIKAKVLLTGGTGFIASHVLDCLLRHGCEVVVTVRSEEKGERVMQSLDEKVAALVTTAVVANIAQDGAFDEVLKSTPFDYVVHTASPYQLRFDDPVKDCLDPAIKGTTGILRSIHAHAPTVKRVVITSSSAAILCPPDHPDVYDESFWSSVTWEDAMDPAKAYVASKKFSEQAAWAFVEDNATTFSLATINNSYTFGPLQRSLASLDDINTSNKRIYDLARGAMRDGIEPTAPVFTFVDVRDVALAHVRAMSVPEAGGKRFYVVSGFFTNHRICGLLRRHFREVYDNLPPLSDELGNDDFPIVHWGFDNSRSKDVLGIRYMNLEQSIVDTVKSILALKKATEPEKMCGIW
ncbi:putative NADPH-dependent methylglyoxal reductase [Staphylotrichum tortipilum]|uniref:NADPH-dependent methylglyoxal reductase n=1 Tax=Staphylotrichum tortipilum TaxID=2831512 RepID=A0AAN6MG64_9PEZI|nr:putative NADPH-dependent methylglyoxal reductase [Staphylotrichum longicolle]